MAWYPNENILFVVQQLSYEMSAVYALETTNRFSLIWFFQHLRSWHLNFNNSVLSFWYTLRTLYGIYAGLDFYTAYRFHVEVCANSKLASHRLTRARGNINAILSGDFLGKSKHVKSSYIHFFIFFSPALESKGRRAM